MLSFCKFLDKHFLSALHSASRRLFNFHRVKHRNSTIKTLTDQTLVAKRANIISSKNPTDPTPFTKHLIGNSRSRTSRILPDIRQNRFLIRSFHNL